MFVSLWVLWVGIEVSLWKKKKAEIFALPISSSEGKSAIKIREILSNAATQNLFIL